MKMKLKMILIVAAIIFSGFQLSAVQSVTFLQDGKMFTGSVVNLSLKNGVIQYWGGTNIHRSKIWMINQVNQNWNFPEERRHISMNRDTIFMMDGRVLHDWVQDFDGGRRVWLLDRNGTIKETKIKRIYFCCNPLPQPYKDALQGNNQGNNRGNNRGNRGGNRQGNQRRYASVFLQNGNFIEQPMSYFNSRKSGFADGLQINSKDIWMINLENDDWDFPRDRRQLDRRLDTIIMKDGEVLYDTLVDFSKNRRTFRFENMDPIRESQISRIYLCCQGLPDAYRNNTRRKSKSGRAKRYR